MNTASISAVAFDQNGMRAKLLSLSENLYLVQSAEGKFGIASANIKNNGQEYKILANIPAVRPEMLGDSSFRKFYKVKYAYKTGAMANGIASEELVIALGKAGMIGSFGAAGLVPARIEKAIDRIKNELPNGAYCFNLIHSPNEERLEREAVALFLKHKISIVEASAFLDLTPHIVYYRAAGLSQENGKIVIGNKVIAKISRKEVAAKFMEPAPKKMLDTLVSEGKITALQAQMASQIPMADDITVEADSGGHTDNRPLVCLLPSILMLRNEIQQKYNYPQAIRIGAAGGISTPESALSAFSMGASYIVTGSVNQACIESGTSAHVKNLLAQAEMTDVMMAPAADMFEMGVKLQVLKRGTMFPLKAQRLYELYKQYNTWEEIPADERKKIETLTFKNTFDNIWQQTVQFFEERDPEQITRAEQNPKRKMALVFRWYLGLSSNWANKGEKGRELDYQIWTGPAMGAFNDWAKDTFLEKAENRKAVIVAENIMRGAAYLYRIQHLKLQGVDLPVALATYKPMEM